jgi:hypothetical protein
MGRRGRALRSRDAISGWKAEREGEQRLPQIFDRVEDLHRQEVLVQRSANRSAQPLRLGARTNAAGLSTPTDSSSFRKTSDMYWDP